MCPSGTTCLPGDCCFGGLALKDPIKFVGLVQSRHHLIECRLFLLKNSPLGIKQPSLTHLVTYESNGTHPKGMEMGALNCPVQTWTTISKRLYHSEEKHTVTGGHHQPTKTTHKLHHINLNGVHMDICEHDIKYI